MSTFPFDYILPPELIAQEPCEPRDHARLLVANRHDGSLHHHHFYDLPTCLQPGDLLVLNDTRVLPARLLGKRARTGGKWEGLFLRQFPTQPGRCCARQHGTLLESEIIEVDTSLAAQEVQASDPLLANAGLVSEILRLKLTCEACPAAAGKSNR